MLIKAKRFALHLARATRLSNIVGLGVASSRIYHKHKAVSHRLATKIGSVIYATCCVKGFSVLIRSTTILVTK